MKMITPEGHGPNLETIQTHIHEDGVLVTALCICDCEYWSKMVYFDDMASVCQKHDWTKS